MTLTVLDLFSGIGGFSLGLERTGGFKTIAFCEIDPFCRQVLAKHWPGVPVYEDVKDITADALAAAGLAPRVICGGFPCQDISLAGEGAGLAGARSGLWREQSRIIREFMPDFALVENVAALLGRGIGVVLRDLAEIGYDAEWDCIPASAVGSPQQRDRVWVVAYPSGGQTRRPVFCDCLREIKTRRSYPTSSARGRFGLRRADQWDSEPSVCRVADGVSPNVDRVSSLGNAVVPQIPELIGRAILSAEAAPPQEE